MRAIDIVRRREQQRNSRRAHVFPLIVLLAALAVMLAAAGVMAGGAAGALAFLAGLPDVGALEELPARTQPSAGVTRLYAWDATGDPRRPVLIDTISDPRAATNGWTGLTTLPPFVGDAYLTALELWPTPRPTPAIGWPLDRLSPPSPLVADLIDVHLRGAPDTADDTRRTAQDWLLAQQVTNRYSPDQLLEWTLNTRYYGQLAYGLEAAAQVYFDRPATDLSPGQAALLAAVARDPAANQFDDPAAALANRNAVLAALVARGALTPDAAATATAEPTATAAPPGSSSAAPAFARLARRELEQLLGPERLLAGGLMVETTLDLALQEQVACATTPRPSGGGPPCPARAGLPATAGEETAYTVVAINPRTGVIEALSGSAEQPTAIGALVRPLIYLTALSRGHTAADLLLDVESVYLLDGHPYVPQNADGAYHGPLRLRQALAGGRAVPAAQALGWVGAPQVLATARALGLEPGPAAPNDLTLAEVGFAAAPLDVAQAFAAFGNGGAVVGRAPAAGNTLPRPATIRRVADANGATLYALEPMTAEALSPELAYLLTDILADAEARGATGGTESRRGAALATGAAEGGGWAVGYTPDRLIAVHAASETANPATEALDLWNGLITTTPGETAEWPRPAALQRVAVCAVSGRRPAPGHDCATVDEWFAPGTEPGVDTTVRSLTVNRETGRLATIFTPPALVEQRTFIDYPPQLAAWAAAEGIAPPPTVYDTIRRVPRREGGAAILSPEPWEVVSGQWSVVGSAGGEGFATYRLAYLPGLWPEAVQIIAEESTPVEAAELAIWDTTLLEDGLYTLLLTVIREDETFDEVAIPVTVANGDH